MNGYFKSFQHTTEKGPSGAPTNLGLSDPKSRSFTEVTVINDTTSDIKIAFKLNDGTDGDFIVPKSIKGFTSRINCSGRHYVLNTITAASTDNSPATGNLTLNFLG